MKVWARAKKWLPAIAWACVISWFSTDTFSGEHTSAFILPALRWLFPHASAETLDVLHAVIRKTAHFAEYFILSILLTHGLRGNDRAWKLRWAIWAVVLAAGYASLDEYHQSFVASRGPSAWDALLDTTGATVAQMIQWLWHLSRMQAKANVANGKTIPGSD